MVTDFIVQCLTSFGQALIGCLLIFVMAICSAWIINRCEDMFHEYKAKKAQNNEQ